MSKARLEIEKLYSVALNPELDYWSQLQPLAQSGELANKATSSELLFRLCVIVDQQAKEIKALQDDRVAIAKKMIELEGKSATMPTEAPTEPLG
jgi:hypothetical protein